LEAAMGGTTGANARLLQRIPLAAGAEHEENGIHCRAILDTGPMAPQGANRVMILWLFITFGDSGSPKQNSHRRIKGNASENPL
jgi:hypothetical protein